jgi:large subunit ribosomal protein L29
MKISELRSKSSDEILKTLTSLHREQFNLKMQKATGQLSKPDQLRMNRKLIARSLTILKEKDKF